MQLGSKRATAVRGAEVADGRRRKDHERVSECSWSFGRVARVLGEEVKGRGGEGRGKQRESSSSRERERTAQAVVRKRCGAVCCCDRHKQAGKQISTRLRQKRGRVRVTVAASLRSRVRAEEPTMIEWRRRRWNWERDSTKAQTTASGGSNALVRSTLVQQQSVPCIRIYIARFPLIPLPCVFVCMYVRTARLSQTCLNSTAERGSKHSIQAPSCPGVRTLNTRTAHGHACAGAGPRSVLQAPPVLSTLHAAYARTVLPSATRRTICRTVRHSQPLQAQVSLLRTVSFARAPLLVRVWMHSPLRCCPPR